MFLTAVQPYYFYRCAARLHSGTLSNAVNSSLYLDTSHHTAPANVFFAYRLKKKQRKNNAIQL